MSDRSGDNEAYEDMNSLHSLDFKYVDTQHQSLLLGLFSLSK